jgi:hypothetical protein
MIDDAWLLGFVSGAGAFLQGELRRTDSDAMVQYMSNYCRNNPLEQVASGAVKLVIELTKGR